MLARVSYTDNESDWVGLDKWCDLPGHGVQSVTIDNGGKVTFDAFSLYWLYAEKDYFVAGGGSVRYDKNFLNEVLIFNDGRQENRKIEFMPDLLHNQVKLGWWNGKKRII